MKYDAAERFDGLERELRLIRESLARLEKRGHVVNMTAPSPILAYSIDDAVTATSIGRSTLYEDIAAGRLAARKRGRSTIILAADLAAYLAALPLLEV